jgi:hypothetical protein
MSSFAWPKLASGEKSILVAEPANDHMSSNQQHPVSSTG